ncbi:hypothetical protein EJB05_48412 [Eragrostis curvula]|uniref:Protein kinase domain-containing protein n=1 Tax=Eragrostis curvula TaxID=38414 RepID=A0A5J9T1V1_9POAL|nr:hypothetical protein EJB05_48412 [Eragrostis curvula]
MEIKIATSAYMGRTPTRRVLFLAVAALFLVPQTLACSSRCGNISIAYPFGIEPGCYKDGFNLTCNRTHHPPKLFLGDGTVEVLEVSIPNGTVQINNTGIKTDINSSRTWGGLRAGGPFFFAPHKNKLLVISCNSTQFTLMGEDNSTITACSTFCPDMGFRRMSNRQIQLVVEDCSGIGCCDAAILKGYTSYNIKLQPPDSPSSEVQSILFIAEMGFYSPSSLLFETHLEALPALLDWVISNSTCHKEVPASECRSSNSFCRNYTSHVYDGYQCSCSAGYEGNPYIPNGCQDINECAIPEVYSCHGICINIPGTFHCRCPDGTNGNASIPGGCIKNYSSGLGLIIGLSVGGGSILMLLGLGLPFMASKIKLYKVQKMKEKFFKQNHGLLLQQLISQKADIGERMLITLAELEKATNNFDKTREIGGGGHGVVYKGILDLHVVAIKKSKIAVQKEISEFINEVAILSQINHRNVVKLLGCCLEAEVPLLVYEFISNGTLYHHLHVEGPASLSWEDRIRIALEVATALAYLHSATTVPVFHRDIKSANILLDDNLTAKVSDFGASRYIPIDQEVATTAVQGTFGYLDPMYYYTGRLTEKSDVFSFGVLLVELVTRKKPFIYRSDDDDSLVSHFASLLTEGKLAEIVDPQVMEEDSGEVQEVAVLAALCTKLGGEDRPTMREVEMTLENLQARKKPCPCNASSNIYDEDQIAAHYMAVEDLLSENAPSVEQSTAQASRMQTTGDEILLEARLPR